MCCEDAECVFFALDPLKDWVRMGWLDPASSPAVPPPPPTPLPLGFVKQTAYAKLT